jgi:ABC-type oligopeptide transport system ATPase subunit
MTLLEAVHLSKRYRAGEGNAIVALDDVSFSIDASSAIGLVGESGSGKSTLIACLLGLASPDEGHVEYRGKNLAEATRSEQRTFRREVQLVFQDPYLSLNPRMTVAQLISEGLSVHKICTSRAARHVRVRELLDLVGLSSAAADRYPRSFSGGQRQRIAIARALAVEPVVLVCDEPVASLDVSVQAQILNLLRDMREKLGLTLVFVAHDLAVVRHLCTEIAVMQHGRIVEHGTRTEVFDSPEHPYTIELLEAVPSIDASSPGPSTAATLHHLVDRD